MSKTPTARDLFEARNLEVRPSTIEGAGDGVFAVRDLINVGDVLGYFNGVRYVSDSIIFFVTISLLGKLPNTIVKITTTKCTTFSG